ncbi:right-handed parallel beta-helix repeat-containing protein [Paenibacillus sp. KQZ6P-2]|uniref:Right-handed parallel beta-helix repeat-containing protein n=1 Tax=Paenibacillus mangrovi TaxID=2931978 RepID=A0A9X1WS58_9BACL|nr:right-handed parallel beta-helix repeat-containing protein [Paenibacillus mangrovi]MCJ8013641.1 right-handed parallel beta-helix repeat-containing protein [Paenibacillus mangrovi]
MIISMDQFGAKPEQGFDNTLAVMSALEYCREIEGAELVFPQGRYHFWPDKAAEKQLFISNHDQEGLRRIAFQLTDHNGITIDGQGSEFIFHGPMIPFVIDHCRNATIRNIVIDWENPMFAQGTVIRADDDSFDLQLPEGTNYKIENDGVWFNFGGKTEKVWGLNEFDPRTKAPAYQSGDRISWGNYRKVRIEESRPGVITYRGKNIQLPQIGNVIVMRFSRRENPAFFVNGGENVILDSINIHHAPGMGLLAQWCRNIRLHKFNVMRRPGSDRMVTATADATHFVFCRGQITIDQCLLENQLDDPCNVHGIYARITEKLGEDQLMVELAHGMSKGIKIAEPGDLIEFVRRDSLLPYANLRAKNVKVLNKDYIIVTFDQPLPDDVHIHDVIGNRSSNPDLTVTHSTVRANRARGFLITTAGSVLLEHNKISTPGAGIKISGDANYWFESGDVKQVMIRNNEFMDCNYCCPDWGRAVIDIDPEIENPEAYEQCYHRNISIENNRFVTFDVGIVSGHSVDGIRFVNNVIETSDSYPPHHVMKYPIELKACKNVTISDNQWPNDSKAIGLVNDSEIKIT